MVFLRISELWCAKVSSAAIVMCIQGFDLFLSIETEITVKGYEETIAYSYLLV
jgi:hypothetical protein